MTAAKITLRPFLPDDAQALADIFCAAIETLAEEDYSAGQREAWATLADDVPRFRAKLEGALTIVAVVDGQPAGFASLKGADTLDMLYVHPENARRGIATTLVDALEKLAAARGAKTLTTDASDTAKPLFAARGYEPKSRNVLPLGDEWIANTTMVKALGAPEPRGTLQ
jgi:putative acetyltransferase